MPVQPVFPPFRRPLFLCIIVLFWSILRSEALDIIVDDSDAAIIYHPPGRWQTIRYPCPSCHGASAYNGTYTEGSHFDPATSQPFPTPEAHVGRRHERRSLNPGSVTVELRFIGSAITLYGLHSPILTNLSFTLDNIQYQDYIDTGLTSESSSHVFSVDGLPETAHVLIVNLAPNSVFLFDYMVYTVSDVVGRLPPQSIALTAQKKKVASFAGAIGGTVGVLALISLWVCVSIIRRRRRTAMREREANGPPMIGPQPFVPRYFPGTVPPPYSPPSRASTSSSQEAGVVRSPEAEPEPVPSYAPSGASHDRTLDTATVLTNLEDVPPPPFGAVTATTATGGHANSIDERHRTASDLSVTRQPASG